MIQEFLGNPGIWLPGVALDFCIGLVVGIAGMRYQWQKRLAAHLAEVEMERQAQQQDFQQQQGLLQSYRENVERLHFQQDQLQQALLAETEKRAGFAEQAHRVQTVEAELAERATQHDTLKDALAQLQADYARIETELTKEKESAEEKLHVLKQAGIDLKQAFQALTAEALSANNQLFLQVATSTLERFHVQAQTDLEQRQHAVEEMVRPLAESLTRYEQEIRKIEQERQHAYARLSQQAENLSAAQGQLIGETAKLIKALRLPQVRGRWGEMTLRRVVELAGMTEHCDFTEQPSLPGDGNRFRPDLIVHLPGEKLVVIDAKAPLQAYLDALEASAEEERQRCLATHARHIRSHLQQLGSKNYWEQFSQTPEFVVLFLPGETFFSAALEQDALLIEIGVSQRVILATPTTLIALLRAVAYGWQQQALTENALAISQLGKELYERLNSVAGHFQELGRALQRSVIHYNRTLGALENRVLVTARKFTELGVSSKQEIFSPETIEEQARSVTRF